MKPKNRLPATNGSKAKSLEPMAQIAEAALDKAKEANARADNALGIAEKAVEHAKQLLPLTVEHAQAIMLHLERICRGGISADATDSVSAIKGILVQAAQASRAPQPAPT